jgi:glycosyltransferase involved in cell wall biosynthesis
MLTSVSNDDNLTIVSIGLPVFNSEKTIADAIKTIINQSFENWELIISDNNSNDSTIKIIEKFTAIDERIFLYKQKKNIGMFPNFDFVLKKSKGKYFHWLAADDLRSVNFLNENISFLDTHYDFVASCSKKYFDSVNSDQKNNKNFSLEQTSPKARIDYLLENIWQSHSIYYSVIRTEIIKKCQFLGEHFMAHDWIIDLFIAQHGKIAIQKGSYIIIGINGISRVNPYKPFRTSWIELILPLYSFHKRFNLLIKSFSFFEKCKLQYKIIQLHTYIIRRRFGDYFAVLIKK